MLEECSPERSETSCCKNVALWSWIVHVCVFAWKIHRKANRPRCQEADIENKQEVFNCDQTAFIIFSREWKKFTKTLICSQWPMALFCLIHPILEGLHWRHVYKDHNHLQEAPTTKITITIRKIFCFLEAQLINMYKWSHTL